MPEQTFSATSGFYDSVSQDRLYTAEDMNKPYKRVITNGVFATPKGTPSTDLQVVAFSGMTIKCLHGDGMFGYKWFQVESDIAITVPSNTALLPRFDSVFARVDTRISSRAGSIVYRTGTESQNPTPPAIDTTEGVFEYRLANVYVAAGAASIVQANISDLRGSLGCPWITSLIRQVDTSTLFAQWQDAYQTYFDESTTTWEEYEAARQAEWDQFFGNLTDELTLSTNVMMLKSSFTTVGTTNTVPIGITGFNPATDILMVYINGVFAQKDVRWSIASGNTSITLAQALGTNQTVDFVCLKSIITGDLSTVETLIQSLENEIDAISADSGWSELTLESGVEAYGIDYTPAVRKYGKQVFVRGAVVGATAKNTIICFLPVGCRPSKPHTVTTVAMADSSRYIDATVVLQVLANGAVKIADVSATIPASARIPLDMTFIVD